MNYSEESLEFNLKDLLFYILYRWKPIVLIAVLLALLLGVVQTYPQYKAVSTTPTEEMLQMQQSYYDQLDIYTTDLENTQKKLDTFQEYLNTSILMNADPRNVYLAKAAYYIDPSYQILTDILFQDPSKAFTLAWHYKDHLQSNSTYTALSEALGIEEKYLMELVVVSLGDSGTLSFSVAHPEQETALAIRDYLDNALYQHHETLTELAEHTLTTVSQSCGLFVYNLMDQTQQEAAKKMTLLVDELNTKTDNLNTFKKTNAPASPNIASTFVKWALVGGVVGGVLMVVFFFLLGIFDNRVYSPDYVATKYGIPALGSLLPASTRFDFVTKWLRHMECLPVESSEGTLLFLAANTSNHISNARDILICSDADAATTDTLATAFRREMGNLHFTTTGSLLQDVQAVKTLPGCSAVLLVFTRNHTNHKYIRKTLNQIRECGKDIIGFIFVG